MDRGLILRNAVIHTMSAAHPVAAAAAIRDGRFVAVGSEAAALSALGPGAAVRDLGGRCVLPGLTDAHLHLQWFAEARAAVDAETATADEALARVQARAAAAAPGAWITGSGWNHNAWGAGSLPTKAALDAAAPRNPVALKAKSGHALWVNSAALAAARIDLATPDPPGGKIVHDREGLPSGVLLEEAMDLVLSVVPRPTTGELARLLADALGALAAQGITAVHDFDNVAVFSALQLLETEGRLPLRVLKGIPHEKLGEALALGIRTGLGSERLRLGHVKMFADGALGPRTAWMLAPYEGTWETGIGTLSEEELVRDIGRANAAGLACAVHAIGDAAVHVVLDAFEKAGRRGLRNRIEHAQLFHPSDAARPAALGVTCSMQPLHATSDMIMAEKHWGSRCTGAYAWRTVLESGAALAFGSDCPVETADPLAGIHAAVTRRRADGAPGPDGWFPRQRLTLDEAVRAYTLGAAHAAGWEAETGSVEPGWRADLSVLDRDPWSIDPREIRSVKAAATMVGGVFVHDAL